MSAISTPISAASCFCLKNTPKPAKSFSKRLSFSGEFSCRKSASWGARRRSLCMDMIKGFGLGGRASTTDDGIGGVSGFEQESFVDDSSLTFEDGGFDATVNNLSKWLISAIFITTLLWRHDAEAVWAAMGSALNAMLSVVLKNILNQERPVSTLRSDPGMPSSHAQSIVYTITFLIVSLVEKFGVNVLTTTLSGIGVILGSYFAWLRISQRLHTVSQVAVGAIVGSIFAFLWFWSWNAFVLDLFISFLWARITITLGAIVFIVCFVLHSYQSWLAEV